MRCNITRARAERDLKTDVGFLGFAATTGSATGLEETGSVFCGAASVLGVALCEDIWSENQRDQKKKKESIEVKTKPYIC